MTALTGEQIAELSKVLSHALDEDDLQLFVHASTGDRLYTEYVSDKKPLRPTIVDLLNALEELGTRCRFLHYVYEQRPQRSDVRSAILKYCPEAGGPDSGPSVGVSAQKRGVEQDEQPPSAGAPGLQRNVRPHLQKVDVRVWLAHLSSLERRICRVERDGGALGTGFLVGKNTVLTNWHVVESASEAGALSKLSCRFDYSVTANGSRSPGSLINVVELVDSSPYSAAEKSARPDHPLPTDQELDYALIRLASDEGVEVLEGVPRGWISLPAEVDDLAPGSPILILQHPDGAPMKLALDTDAVISTNENGTRLRYATNTEPGSSGSPCFTMDWDLVALHHLGDPAWRAPTFNQGVPIQKVRKLIVQRGFGADLGP